MAGHEKGCLYGRSDPMRHCTVCGKYMNFEGVAELAGTAIVRLVDPMPNQLVSFFSCECGRIESVDQDRCSARSPSRRWPRSLQQLNARYASRQRS